MGFAGLVVAIGLDSTRDRIGDGAEYMAMTIQLAHLHLPAVSGAQWPDLARALNHVGHGYGIFDVSRHNLAAQQRQDFPHFWFYSLLAVPYFWLVTAVGLNATWAFFALNCSLLGAALTVLARQGARLITLACVGVSPILWWVAPAHTEVLTYSCIVVALTWARRHPIRAIFVVAVGSTQNVPLLALALLIFIWWLVSDPRSALSPRALIRLAPAIAISALAPAYYLVRIHALSLLATSRATESGPYSVRKLIAPLMDLDIGLVPRDPAWLGLLMAVLVVPAARRFVDWRLCAYVVLPALLTFVWSFAETTNVNHGGTPGMSRYALWVIALSTPVLRGLDKLQSSGTRLLAFVTVTAFLVSTVVFYRPSLSESYLQPTATAEWVWDHHPDWNNPYPEIFFERLGHAERPLASIATSSCSKVLVVDGLWPVPCSRSEHRIPRSCASQGSTCYANRVGQATFAYVRVSRN